MDDSTMSAGKFKATCLKVMDEVAASGRSVVITKRGRPVARLVAVDTPKPLQAGALAHTIEVLGDIEQPLYFINEPAAEFDEVNETDAPYASRRAPRAKKKRSR